MPANSGSGVINLAYAASIPTASPDSTGVTVWAEATGAFVRTSGGFVTQWG